MAFLWAIACLALASTVSGCVVPAVSPSVQYSERIINGRNAVPGSWPWQVSLQTSSGSHFCGSSLIDENWVVTAAHCAFDPSSVVVVVLGEYDLGSNAESVQMKTVAKVVTDPSWNSDSLNNDMALLKLSSPAQLAPRVSPASLALPATLRGVTTGWGRTGTASPAVAVSLQQVALPLISRCRCSQYWGNQTTSSMLCAGGVGTSSCQGDSGRPLVYQNGNTWTWVGIVSWGSSNCNVRTPAVYTRASRFRNRIPFATLQPKKREQNAPKRLLSLQPPRSSGMLSTHLAQSGPVDIPTLDKVSPRQRPARQLR